MSKLAWDDIREKHLPQIIEIEKGTALSAYRQDEEKGRIDRLERVVGYVTALGEYFGNGKVLDKVSHLHDHKGALTVTWRQEPTDGEQEFFTKAWESRIGDGANNVFHEMEPATFGYTNNAKKKL